MILPAPSTLLPLDVGVEGGRAGMTVQCLRLGSSVSTYSMLSQADSVSLSPLPPRSHWPRRSSAWSWLYPRQQTSSVTSVSPMVVAPLVVTLLRLW